MKKFTKAALALGLLAVPALASAADAWTRSAVNLRTGPDADYPRIVTLRGGQPLQVYGCISDWSWCDVSSGGYRGWVSAGFLDYERNGRRVQVSVSGASLGLPVLSFVLGTYWDQHYRGKSWYAQRPQYEKRHPQHAGPAQGRQNAGAPSHDGRPQSSAPVQQHRTPQQQPAQSQRPGQRQDGRTGNDKQPDRKQEPERRPR